MYTSCTSVYLSWWYWSLSWPACPGELNLGPTVLEAFLLIELARCETRIKAQTYPGQSRRLLDRAIFASEDSFRHYHLLHGSASHVVRMGRSVNGNRPKLTPCRSETPRLIKTKLNTIHYVRGTPHRPKLVISRWKGPRPQRVNI
jgi:hypothetical protein